MIYNTIIADKTFAGKTLISILGGEKYYTKDKTKQLTYISNKVSRKHGSSNLVSSANVSTTSKNSSLEVVSLSKLISDPSESLFESNNDVRTSSVVNNFLHCGFL